MGRQATNEPGIGLGWSLIGLLALLLVAGLAFGVELGPGQPGLGTVFIGLYVLVWGLMFLASYFYSHKTFFLRGLIWVCEHFSAPKGRGMALFYAALGIFLGSGAILKGVRVF